MATAIEASGYNAAQLRTIKHTVAADTNDLEFDLFMEACRSYGLDPFRKQIHAVVYSKDKPDKRKMSIIVSRDGLRVLAQRCNDYRPASEPARIEYDDGSKGPANPKGIVSATVTLWKQDNRGEWYPVIGEAYWDEFAPIIDEWAWDDAKGKRAPTGKKSVEGNWAKMPIVMITKCAESQALRAGWPDQFGNIYSEEEMTRLAVDQTATETLREMEKSEREARIGGRGVLMVFDDAMKLEKVPMGNIADRCLEFVKQATPDEAHAFRIRNENSLREFWAHSPADALAVKKALDAKEAQMKIGDVA
ncbi:MAG TPA: phage recombination protein Bet [Alphaproteobacteria bacterium]|nr:phage recombination protein Bet [Alphaproteobacteria bacterium]